MTTTSVGSLTNSNHRDVETNTNFWYELWRQSPENGDDNINVDEIDVAHRIEVQTGQATAILITVS